MSEWQSALVMTTGKQPVPRAVAANVITILGHAPEWAGVLGYDEMRETIVKLAPPPWHEHDAAAADELGEISEADITRLCAWFSRAWDMTLRPQTVAEAAHVVAQRRRFNPVRDFLGALKWDGTVRLPGLLSRYAGAADDDYTRGVSTRIAIAAVARAYVAACKVDTIAVLEGPQGSGKSTFVRALARQDEWFFDSDLSIGDKDAPQALRGKWIVELGEMSALGKAERGALKAFVTRQTDTYRPSFGRVSRDFPRRWIAIGTTNEDRYLRDATGNRRWLPVRTGKIDLVALRRDVDQLWAEARTRYEQGERWHVDSAAFAELAEAEQDDRFLGDPWEQSVGQWLEANRAKLALEGHVTTADVLSGALMIDAGRQSKADEMRVAEILPRLGWTKGNRKLVRGVRVYPYLAPVRIAQPANEVGHEVGHTEGQENKRDPNLPNLPNLFTHTQERRARS